ncbi:MAG: class I SAM-dependent methyltransferase [Chitinophagales bacterium]
MNKDLIKEVNKYYTEKVLSYGASPKGADWNGTESQIIRFEQLLKLIPDIKKPFSLLDYGCGYGSMLGYLNEHLIKADYTGYDISEEMIKKAKEIHSNSGKWLNSLPNGFKADYVVASGLLNVKQHRPIKQWEDYVLSTLDQIDQISKLGFAFNILTSYSDKEYMRDHLYYAEPEKFFKLCKTKYSKEVALLHDYQLYEFTIIVRK